MLGVLDRSVGPTFVRFGDINYRKERLVLFQLFKIDISCRVERGCIPAVPIGATTDVVIGFIVIETGITGFVEHVGIVGNLAMWNRVSASHGMGSRRYRMDSCDPGAPLWRTDRRCGKAMRIAKTLLRQLINPRRIRIGISITADPLDVVVLGSNPEDVGSLGNCRRGQ